MPIDESRRYIVKTSVEQLRDHIVPDKQFDIGSFRFDVSSNTGDMSEEKRGSVIDSKDGDDGLLDEEIGIVEEMEIHTLWMNESIINFITAHMEVRNCWMEQQELIDHF